jgi:hypothetical protein
MKTCQHTAEQIVKILEQAERGEQTIAVICRELGMLRTPFECGAQAHSAALVTHVKHCGSRGNTLRAAPADRGCPQQAYGCGKKVRRAPRQIGSKRTVGGSLGSPGVVS